MDQMDGHNRAPNSPAARYERALNRVAKWRSILAGRIVGTRPDNDPETQGIRDMLDKLVILRVEVTTLTRLLLEKRVFTAEEFFIAGAEEADAINKMYADEWPGITAEDYGIDIKLPEGAATLARKSRP
jgi:hypothetical protein